MVSTLLGCAVPMPPTALLVTPEQTARREKIETRRYSGIKEEEILAASAQVLQDLSYNLDNSETRLGVILAASNAMQRARQVVGAVVIALLGGGATPIDKDQTIRVSLVVRPLQSTKDNDAAGRTEHFVQGQLPASGTRTDNSVYMETLKENELYTGFFERLSKSVFIEGQKI